MVGTGRIGLPTLNVSQGLPRFALTTVCGQPRLSASSGQVTPPRGQITIPVKFREELGIGYSLLLQQLGERKFMVNFIPHRTPADFPTVDIDIAWISSANRSGCTNPAGRCYDNFFRSSSGCIEDAVITDSSPSDSGPLLPVGVSHAGPFPRSTPVRPAEMPRQFKNACCACNVLDPEVLGENRPIATDDKLVACLIERSDGRAEKFTLGL